MSNLKIWTRVPDNSTLSVKVIPKGSGVVAAAAVTIDDGGSQQLEWTQADLVPGPKILTLRKPERVAVRLWFQFKDLKTASADIEAEIHKNDGSLYGVPYRYTVSGSKGQVERVTIAALTLLN